MLQLQFNAIGLNKNKDVILEFVPIGAEWSVGSVYPNTGFMYVAQWSLGCLLQTGADVLHFSSEDLAEARKVAKAFLLTAKV